MGGDLTQPQTAFPAQAGSDRLDSWKEIAAYLKKEVRTVQRWEKSAGLPVRRLTHGKLGTVFAYRSELDAWWQESQSKVEFEENDVPQDLDHFELEVTEFVRTGESEDDPAIRSPRLRRLIILCSVVASLAVPIALIMLFWPPTPPPVLSKMILAVRPFKNLSGDSGQDFIADGMTEEMITRLGQMHPDKMGVIRLSPAYASVGLARIGKDVGAQYVLEGGVRRSEQQVAITAQLIQISDQTQVWGESYERDLKDLLRMESEVARVIAVAVLNKVPERQPSPDGNSEREFEAAVAESKVAHTQGQTRQVNGDAYLAYLEGRYFWNKRTEAGFAKAITFFQRSIDIDPTYAPPYAGLADCYELLGSAPYSTLRPREAFPKAEAAARKALALDSTLAEAHVSLGYYQMVYEWNFPEARIEFETALQLRPSYATAHQFYGYYLTAMGQPDEAIAERKKALELDPISPLLHSALGEAYYQAKRFDVTITQNNEALELDPGYAIALVNIGRAYERMGMHQEARDAFQKLLTVVPEDPAILALLGHEYAVSGDKVNAAKGLAKLSEVAKKRYVPAIYFAVIYIGLDRRDDAFLWLDKAYQERCEYLVYLGSEPLADPLRGDPRFSKLLTRLGLKTASIATALPTP
jgi:TolB-like protein/Flp pilus assembly protein TadD